MKFAWTERAGKGEYEMYSYLNAIENPNVLANGIPSILYFGTWKAHTMMGITLHDTKFMNAINAGTVEELDLLIIFREFVSQRTNSSAYIYLRLIQFSFTGENNKIHT